MDNKEKLIDIWGRRNPNWEIKYEDTIIKPYCDYGRGTSQYMDDRGKIYGAGYEIFIIAFFIGLYFDRTKKLTTDSTKKKPFGQPIQYWGNIENRNKRNSYGELRNYMFAALVAKTDVDFIALDKGEITPREVVDKLIDKMEEYANYGFDYMLEQTESNPEYYFKEGAFLKLFMPFITKEKEESEDNEPESLD